MKKYTKPQIDFSELSLEDIICVSALFTTSASVLQKNGLEYQNVAQVGGIFDSWE